MSKQSNRNFSRALRGLLTVALGLVTGTAAAAEWALSDTPLFLGTVVPANVIFLIDDSGSMDWASIIPDPNNDGLMVGNQPDGTNFAGAGTPKTVTYVKGGTTYTCAFPPGGAGLSGIANVMQSGKHVSYTQDVCYTAAMANWRYRNVNFNPLYFDPKKDYTPWKGYDSAGNPYQNIDITNAPFNPFEAQASQNEYYNLTAEGAVQASPGKLVALAGGWYFYTWKDANGNGKFEDGEETAYQIGNLDGELGTIAKVDTVGLWGKTVAQVKQNFANWFSYHRARHLVAKYGLSEVAYTMQNIRAALVTINSNNVSQMDIALVDQSATGETNRKTLLHEIAEISPSGTTPSVQALNFVGNYLMGKTNNPFSATKKAPLPAGQGGESQQNFTPLLTDGFYNSWKTQNPSITDADADKNSAWDGGTYAMKNTTYSNLADVAMYYYETDLQPTTANSVPTILGVDQNNAQHMVTYTIAFGMNGTIKCMPNETVDEDGKACPKFTAWPDPLATGAKDAYKIDDLRHAAYNGRGKYLEASDPDKLVAALKDMMNNIVARTAATAALSFNTTTVRTDTLVFQAKYHTKDWAGDLLYVPFAQIDGGLVTDFVSVAAQLLKKDWKSRTIITSNGTTAAPFQWASLTAAQQTALGSNEKRFNYLRGDRSCEIGNGTDATCGGTAPMFRQRGSVLKSIMGDIVDSAPAFVGAPSRFYPFDNYSDFAVKNANRKPMVYVGANDGMIHGFDASINLDGTFPATSGEELIAYVPNKLYTKMATLSDIAYSHTYFVDGSPTAGDANFGDSTNPDWHTVLVTGMRTGGQAMVALDITDPSQYSEANAGSIFLWEFSDANDADLGRTFSDPIIVRTNQKKWVAIFGNGLNNTTADGIASTTGNAVIYIVDIQTGALIRKLDTTYGMSKDPKGLSRANGITSVKAIDGDGDYMADYVYGGDMFGNIWRFDITDANPANWKVSFGNLPLFTAKAPDGTMQTITAKLAVGAHPSQPGYMVYFGTGKYIDVSDNQTTGVTTQTFYAIWDKWEKGDLSAFTAFTRANLLQQKILEEFTYSWGSTFRLTTDYVINWNTQMGWYMDLINTATGLNNGERVVTEPVVRNGRVIFSTLIPASGPCVFGGSGWLMMLDAYDGSRFGQSPLDLNGDGVFNELDLVSFKAGTLAVSGAQSTHGIPSAPALIQGEGGTSDLILMNFSDGTLGGTGATNVAPVPVATQSNCTDSTDPACTTDIIANTTSKPNVASTGTPQGRLMWQRLQ